MICTTGSVATTATAVAVDVDVAATVTTVAQKWTQSLCTPHNETLGRCGHVITGTSLLGRL
jgi:hypothetical protein